MARGLSLVSLLATLLAVGWLLTAQNGHSPTRSQTTQAVDQAQQAAATLTFQQAQTQLEQAHALNGTYAGASVAGFGVTLVRADAASYCLQTGSGTAVSHLAGPGGSAASGPC
jgi:Tfp pilus assembly protein PilE